MTVDGDADWHRVRPSRKPRWTRVPKLHPRPPGIMNALVMMRPGPLGWLRYDRRWRMDWDGDGCQSEEPTKSQDSIKGIGNRIKLPKKRARRGLRPLSQPWIARAAQSGQTGWLARADDCGQRGRPVSSLKRVGGLETEMEAPIVVYNLNGDQDHDPSLTPKLHDAPSHGPGIFLLMQAAGTAPPSAA